jgi:2-polyprenyl-3-methyl-5-hydroxy-6-metoxy-1,4-benzoquinol methylase
MENNPERIYSWFQKIPASLFGISNLFYQFIMLTHKPEQFLNLAKKSYQGPASVEMFGSKRAVDFGFTDQEQRIYSKYITKKGTILVVGCAGGRETIPFARAGHKVVGIDYIPDLIETAKTWAKHLNLNITYATRDICQYTPTEDFYDFVTFTIYFFMPTRKLRIAILKRLRGALKEDGLIFINFSKITERRWSLKNKLVIFLLKRINPDFESGDYLEDIAFTHHSSEEELRKEVALAGFNVLEVSCDKYRMAVLGKGQMPAATENS